MMFTIHVASHMSWCWKKEELVEGSVERKSWSVSLTWQKIFQESPISPPRPKQVKNWIKQLNKQGNGVHPHFLLYYLILPFVSVCACNGPFPVFFLCIPMQMRLEIQHGVSCLWLVKSWMRAPLYIYIWNYPHFYKIWYLYLSRWEHHHMFISEVIQTFMDFDICHCLGEISC